MKRSISIILLLSFILVGIMGCRDEEAPDTEAIIDIAAMGGTMAGATILNMLDEPGRYLGKTVRVAGIYQPVYWDEGDRYFHDIVVESQAGCCPKFIEFILSGDKIYPDDYPEEGTMIEIIGIYLSYELDGQVLYYLAVDELIKLHF